MANKLPWFTHDHDAHEDEFLQRAMDEFGVAAYSNYFITLELIHNHGTGGVLRMGAGRYARHLRSRLDLVKKWLAFCGSYRTQSGDQPQDDPKIKSTFIRTQSWEDVVIENKNFIERQGKLKFKTPSKLRQNSVKTPQEGEGEGEGEGENNLAPSAQKTPTVESKPKELTDAQKLIRYFKESKGVNADDKDWDRRHYCGRLIKEAVSYLKSFDGNVKDAGEYLLTIRHEWGHLEDWSLPGAKAKAGRDPRINGGSDDSEPSAVDAARLDGPGRRNRTASAGSLAGEALRSLEHAAIHSERESDVDGPGGDFTDD